jgi:class 3 adenylate cyclase/pSer/pThr/pTyr-binding forkhead associated (FHA) protein
MDLDQKSVSMVFLEITDGISRGQRIPLDQRVVIGRSSHCTLCIPDNHVSRRHAEIREKDGYYVVIDLGSANGTLVNGKPLHKLVPQPLYDRDRVRISETTIVFRGKGKDPISPKTASGAAASQPGAQQGKLPTGTLSLVMTQDEEDEVKVDATLDASSTALDIDESDKRSIEKLQAALARYRALLDVSLQLGAIPRTGILLEKIMESIFEVFPQADRAFILIKDPLSGELVPASGRTRAGTGETLENYPVSKTIINTVIEKKQSVLSSDAQHDDRFEKQKSIVHFSIRAVMCSPLVCRDELLGVISIDTTSKSGSFNTYDLAMLTGIASHAAIALKNVELFGTIQRETQIRTQLSRYVSPDVVEGVIDGTIPLQLGGEKKRGTVMFCDIVGFTAMAEQLSAVDVVDKLNRAFCLISDIITRNSGTLHKFEGDMVMAFWNVMFEDQNAQMNAIRTSIEIHNALWSFNCDLAMEGKHAVHVGIGCNTGEFAGGNIGGRDRMEYTIIGDNVNLAQRIESLAGRNQVFASPETCSAVFHCCSVIQLRPVAVKGRAEPVPIYSVRGIQCSSSYMLLNIPVHIFTPDGELAGSGLITGSTFVNNELQINFVTRVSIAAWEKLTLQLDLQEYASALRFEGTVSSINRARHDGRALYSKISLKKLTGDREALAIAQAGFCGESQRPWEQMKRS